jgi:alpha-tubulin suppressor-like RCC1 family protein
MHLRHALPWTLWRATFGALALCGALLSGCGGGGGGGEEDASAVKLRSAVGIGPAGGVADGGAGAPGFRVQVPDGALGGFARVALSRSSVQAPALSLGSGQLLAAHVYRIEAAPVGQGGAGAAEVGFKRPLSVSVPVVADALDQRRAVVLYAAAASASASASAPQAAWQRVDDAELQVQAALGLGQGTLQVALPGPGHLTVVGEVAGAAGPQLELASPVLDAQGRLALTVAGTEAAGGPGIEQVQLWVNSARGLRLLGVASRDGGSALAGSWTLGASLGAADNGPVQVLAWARSGDGRSGLSAVRSLNVALAAPGQPELVRGPAPQQVNEGEAASFTVLAAGTGLSYQWLRNGVPIPGATAAQLSTGPLSAQNHNGDVYSVQVRGSGGATVTSAAVSSTVIAVPLAADSVPPVFDGQPSTTPVTEPAAASFSATVSGAATISYQWQRLRAGRWVDILGANGTTYALNPSSRARDHGAQFRLIATNAQSATSNVVTATVYRAPGVVNPMLTAGSDHSIAIATNGQAFSWGGNADGQLASGSFEGRAAPGAVTFDPRYGPQARLAAGSLHTLALQPDGTVRAWGYNGLGQLGNGTFFSSVTPVTVSGLSGVVAVAAGGYHSLALLADGTVRAWGYNNQGQLGDGSTTDRNAPVTVSGLSGVVAVAAGDSHSLALLADGTVRAWGYNANGQLGDGTTTFRSTPVTVSGLSGVVAVAAGGDHSLALRADGTVRAWGRNLEGQLGDGSTTSRSTPVTVSGLSGVVAVEAGDYHSLALLADGTVRAWGYNFSGQLGDGSTTNRSPPVTVSGLSGVVAVVAGGYHSLAIRSDGTVRAWGNNDYGQLSDGSFTNRSTPVPSRGSAAPPKWVEVRSGRDVSFTNSVLARDSGGLLWGWGQVRLGTAMRRTGAVPLLTDVASAATSATHALVVLANGQMRTWGTGSDGQLGNGSTFTSTVPVTVTGVSTAVAAAAGASHSLALLADGTVRAWGLNSSGQLGDNSTTSRSTPVAVSGLTLAIAVDAGDAHSVALRGDGTVRAWGNNSFGQLGDGSTTQRNAPVTVSGLSGVVAVAAGSTHTLALQADGTVRAWGSNSSGQLGDGSTTDRPTPVIVAGLTDVVAIAAGNSHSLAIRSDGTVWAWGSNASRQLGFDDGIGLAPVPRQIPGLLLFGYTRPLRAGQSVVP